MPQPHAGEFYHDYTYFMTDPPARLTQAGRKLLIEVWKACDSPSSPNDFVAVIRDLESFQRNARSAGHVLQRLLDGGYLNATVHSTGDSDMEIIDVELSERAFAALMEAGIIGT